jgi:hypothetical protein
LKSIFTSPFGILITIASSIWALCGPSEEAARAMDEQ